MSEVNEVAESWPESDSSESEFRVRGVVYIEDVGGLVYQVRGQHT